MHWDTAKFQILSMLTHFLIAHWHFMKNANKLWTKAILERKRSCLTKNNAYKKKIFAGLYTHLNIHTIVNFFTD